MTSTLYGPTLIEDEIARIQPIDPESASGRRAETLLKTDDLRIVLITMRAGFELAEHTAPGTISIQVLSGQMTVEADGVSHELAAGELIALAGTVPHSVHAREDGSFLLTIAWSERRRG